jgi:transposase-like protein
MIRLFSALCKTLLEHFSDLNIFEESADIYVHHDKGCPRCGATGKLSPYGGYFRWLVFRWKRKNTDIRVWVRRFKCEACGATHALLPDILVPYSIYSLNFKLTVLIAYFERDCTVEAICAEYGIAVSTLYEWLKRLTAHKDLMIGVMMSRKTRGLEFLRELVSSDDLSESLSSFSGKHGFSFMQGNCQITTKSNPP